MDIQRDPPKKTKRWVYLGAVLGVVVIGTVALARLEPAAPSVDRGILFVDSVMRGEMVREVRGPGTLVPENLRFISAVTAGRVERIQLLPGAEVEENTVLMELSNPDVQIQALNAERQLTDAQAAVVTLRTNLENGRLSQASLVADLKQQAADAKRRAEAGAELLKKGLIIPLDQMQAQDKAEALESRLRIEKERLELLSSTIDSQLSVQQEQVERLKAITRFQQQQVVSMVVRAGASGVLQEVPLQVGQWANPGAVLARIVPVPQRLKAVLRIPEVQAKDIQIGQSATIDTRNGMAPGHVTRVDPSVINGTVTVDVALDGEPPSGARPDLSVDGVIEIERLSDVLYTGRPAYGQANATVGIFRIEPDGSHAVRVPVQLGRTSVNHVEIQSGLSVGDKVILSDMSRWDAVDRVRLK